MKNIIKDLRNKKNLTQEELASLLKVSRQTVIAIENGRYDPSLPLAFRIAAVFKKNIEEIFMKERK